MRCAGKHLLKVVIYASRIPVACCALHLSIFEQPRNMWILKTIIKAIIYSYDEKIIIYYLITFKFSLFSHALLFFLINITSVTPASQCLPVFPDKDGWYGGDGAYSIKLDEKRTLWLFGDTFVAHDEGRKDRIDMDVILGTTLAISTCSANNEFEIKYYLKKKNEKLVSSFR